MNTASLFRRIQSDGVNLSLTPRGTIKLVGDEDAVARWTQPVREHKPELVEWLQARGAVSYWWRVRFPDGSLRVYFSPSGDSRESILEAHPEADDAVPFALEQTPPDAPMSASEEEAIRAWLSRIDERAQEVIDEVLTACGRSMEARISFIGLSKKD